MMKKQDSFREKPSFFHLFFHVSFEFSFCFCLFSYVFVLFEFFFFLWTNRFLLRRKADQNLKKKGQPTGTTQRKRGETQCHLEKEKRRGETQHHPKKGETKQKEMEKATPPKGGHAAPPKPCGMRHVNGVLVWNGDILTLRDHETALWYRKFARTRKRGVSCVQT